MLTASAVLAASPSAATAARERACEPVRNLARKGTRRVRWRF